MNFVGTGWRLQSGDVGRAAKRIGIETAVLLSFLEVEAAGRGFDNQNRVKMLFEPHIFWRNLKGPLRQKAVEMGLAYQRWKPGSYPRDSYPRLEAAISLDAKAAYLSASYGLGQIMGFNYKDAGHLSVLEFVKSAQHSECRQLIQLVTLMKSWGMASMLKPGKDYTNPDNWRSAAKRYNGSGYAKHGYHIKLAKAYEKHSGWVPSLVSEVSTVLKIGSKSEAVRNLQSDLQTLGYEFHLGVLGVDGRFGPETKKHVELFQMKHGLTVDGWAGEKTLAKIETELKQLKVDKFHDMPVFNKKAGWLDLILSVVRGFFK